MTSSYLPAMMGTTTAPRLTRIPGEIGRNNTTWQSPPASQLPSTRKSERIANGTQPKEGNCLSRKLSTNIVKLSLTSQSYLKITNELFTELMQHKMDQVSSVHDYDTATIATTTKIAEKRSNQFLYEVLFPRGITVISDSRNHSMLKSLQEDLGSNQLALKEVLGNAFVELDGSKVAKGFKEMKKDDENEAMFEAEYRDTFLKSGGPPGNLGVVCRYVQPKMIVEGPMQNTWIPLPVAIDRRESGIALSKTVWDLVSNIYPNKAGEDNCKYFIIDHIYAFNAKNEEEQSKILAYQMAGLPGFLLLKGRNGVISPYLVEESRDHRDKEREARQYLSLLAASALHDRMLLRSLTDKAQVNKIIALDPELCIYGMTYCAELVSIYKMSIRGIWSDPGLSERIKKPVRYDFARAEAFDLTRPIECKRLSDWMNTLHLYGRTIHAKLAMQDGEKAYSSKIFQAGHWQKELSKVAFLYGPQPNTAIFMTTTRSSPTGGGNGKQPETPAHPLEKLNTPMYRGNPNLSQMRRLGDQLSACNVCKKKNRKCPDLAYAGKDAWERVDWEMADCTLIRRFIQPKTDE